MAPRLIYCDGQNERLAKAAIDQGFEYGIRFPASYILDKPLSFIDVDWKKPERDRYIQGVLNLKPDMASVIDITSEEIYAEALEWAKSIAHSINKIILIPKIPIIHRIPKCIYNTEVILGYSVPSTYGKTDIAFEEFLDFKVHLLGGSPHVQMRLFTQYPNTIYSIDGNYMTKMANKTGRYWVPGNNEEVTNRFWRRDLTRSRVDLFSLSCYNVYHAWQHILEDNDWLRDKRRKQC